MPLVDCRMCGRVIYTLARRIIMPRLELVSLSLLLMHNLFHGSVLIRCY